MLFTALAWVLWNPIYKPFGNFILRWTSIIVSFNFNLNPWKFHWYNSRFEGACWIYLTNWKIFALKTFLNTCFVIKTTPLFRGKITLGISIFCDVPVSFINPRSTLFVDLWLNRYFKLRRAVCAVYARHFFLPPLHQEL